MFFISTPIEKTHIPASKLRGYDAFYKTKLRTSGYHLAYEVIDNEMVIHVLVIGKRDKDAVYKKLVSRSGD
ncbi:type II toxin-antitoxin system RelE family toxin [Marinomonas ushuaiensis]|uniref:type II toxin-antitoxin system RelE family toxin n=1 Tax=Marinomonas ushuaiensis TaxID=263818 RepID=UPI0004B22A9E|nr:hypothetical protein [Marinomonas ushuaiensis]